MIWVLITNPLLRFENRLYCAVNIDQYQAKLASAKYLINSRLKEHREPCYYENSVPKSKAKWITAIGSFQGYIPYHEHIDRVRWLD